MTNTIVTPSPRPGAQARVGTTKPGTGPRQPGSKPGAGSGATKPGPGLKPGPGGKSKPGRTAKSVATQRRRKILLGAAAVATAVGVGLWLGTREAKAANLGQPDRKTPKPKASPKPKPAPKGGKDKNEGKDGKDKNEGKDGQRDGKGGDGARGPKTPKKPKPKPPTDGGGGEDRGPNPKSDELYDYYADEYPDPGHFYQVTSGGADAKGLESIARRWFLSSLFLAARTAGGLSDVAAVAWAQNTITDALVREAMDYILCTAWNDVIYGSYRVAAHNRRGPHGRGIDLVPQHAANWERISQGREALRNVRLHQPGEVGTPRNVGAGDRRLPLLWMPRLNDEVLWNSEGTTLKAGGSWGDGSSMYFPPPVVMNAAIEDPTSAGLGVWGCGAGRLSYE